MIALLTPSPRDPWPSAILFIFLVAAALLCTALGRSMGAF